MYYDFFSMLGYTYNANIFSEAFGSASNVFLTDNPAYTIEDFLQMHPKFSTINEVTNELIDFFILVATSSLKEARFKNMWKYLMGLYVAHLLTLHLQAIQGTADMAGALQSALPRGIISSKSVDGLSLSFEFAGVNEDLNGYGTFKYTSYGQILATHCKTFGHAGMWVNG